MLITFLLALLLSKPSLQYNFSNSVFTLRRLIDDGVIQYFKPKLSVRCWPTLNKMQTSVNINLFTFFFLTKNG